MGSVPLNSGVFKIGLHIGINKPLLWSSSLETFKNHKFNGLALFPWRNFPSSVDEEGAHSGNGLMKCAAKRSRIFTAGLIGLHFSTELPECDRTFSRSVSK